MTTPAHAEFEVEVQTEELEGGRMALDVRVPPEPVRAAREVVIAEASRRVSIPGFRKGKAPRALLARFLDQDFIRERLIEDLVPQAYENALKQTGLTPLGQPEIEDPVLTDEDAITFKATITRRPEITLGEYQNLAATKHVTPVTEEQVDAELDRVRARSTRFADVPAEGVLEKGDLAVVDYDMYVEGERREEGSAAGYPLEVGADELFPQLSDALPGAKVEETVEFEVAYPEDHSEAALAGKTATFKVTVQQARRRQLPELDDEFAKKVSDLQTMEELRTRVRENLIAIGEAVAMEDVRAQLRRQVSESASLDVPAGPVQREVERRMQEVNAELERRNDDLHDHLARHGRTVEDWRADLEAQARQDVREMLILDEIGEREHLEVTEEEIHADLHERAEREGVSEHELHERLERGSEWARLYSRLHHRKILQWLVDHAQVTEEVAEPKPEDGVEPEPKETPESPQAG